MEQNAGGTGHDPSGGGVMARTLAESRGRPYAAKTVVLTVPGEREPEVYSVCSDVFEILGKMLATNQFWETFGNGPRFGHNEVPFLVTMLGAPRSSSQQRELQPVDLWISDG